jgi:murein tripeptide amidase MpaA
MDFNHYFTNDEIEAITAGWTERYPTLASRAVIGYSYEKRPIWLLTLTNQATGADKDKPAVWIDANIHATELMGTTAALSLAETLLSGYEEDPQVTRLLDRSVYYLVPRINPDGAALAMAANPRYIRSGVRLYPYMDKEEGLHEEDIDGDGRILQMRIPDPNGDWKVSSLDPRLMQKRGPAEHGGVYYRLLPEGRLHDYDGFLIKSARPVQGLDFNRNFPFEWRPEHEQEGAGPFPGSEAEIKTLLDFITAHPNINLAITFHTYSRVILRPYSTKADENFETSDLWVYQKLGEIGSQLSGYKNVSTFHDFKYHPKEITTGGFDDWLFDHLGAFTWTIELWDLPDEAGIKERKFIEWYRDHPHEQDLQILKWLDEHVGPQGYIDWYPYDHPQLGRVELGGWNSMYTWRNPPHALAGAEAARVTPFALALGETLPNLSIHTLAAEALGDGRYHLNLVVENSGFLPTFTSEQGKKRNAARPVRVELELPAGAELLSGRSRVELGHLQGRSNRLEVTSLWESGYTDHRARAEWVIQARPGATLKLHILSDRAGNLHREVTFPA